MDLRKLLLVTWKDLRIQYSDTAGLIINLAAPLIMTFLIAAAFSNLTGGSAPIRDIPVIIVNQDEGGGFQDFGKILADNFLTPPNSTLDDMINATAMTDVQAAKAEVRAGRAAAAVIIPANFSASLNPMAAGFGDTPISLTVYRDAGSPLSAEIMSSIVRSFVNSFASANIAGAAAGQASLVLIPQIGSIAQEVAVKSQSEPPITIRAADAPPDSEQESSTPFNLLQWFAPSMAVFFMTFNMGFGILSIMEERERWTLQRMLISPTARATVLAGKVGGTYVTGVVQLGILIIATTLIAPVMGIQGTVWGSNALGLVVFVLVSVAASLGVGTLLAGIAKDRQQAAVIINAALIVLGIIGGSFFVSAGGPPLGVASQLTPNYWATNGFFIMARTDVLPIANVLGLLGIFVVTFGIGLLLFSRRLDV